MIRFLVHNLVLPEGPSADIAVVVIGIFWDSHLDETIAQRLNSKFQLHSGTLIYMVPSNKVQPAPG